ncbi:unnamed protein product [Leptidea sinapis]|uniref:Uncharacterized protein n=1 Tax=Leptidea sinapis TaxID=189913 RepID=A0A5E4Q0T3_9NEOP|nr:unnamed protein product [Leptidea sinapis]
MELTRVSEKHVGVRLCVQLYLS